MSSSAILAATFDSAVACTPNDSTQLDASAFIIGGAAGTIAIQNQLGTTISIANGLAGVVYPISVVRVMATGTTATGIILLS